MASGAPGERLQEEARCSVCLDFLQDPISVDCGHSFCLRCISEFCEKSESAQGDVYACPQCRGPFRPENFRPNRQLASLVDSVRQLGLGAEPAGARQCARHGEDLSRFCEEDQAFLCWVCDTTPEHQGHRTAPLREAARSYQGVFQLILQVLTVCSTQVKLQMALELVRKEMEEAMMQEANVGRRTVLWKEKVEMQRQRFRLEFEKHRGFLALEEQLQLWRLEEEERATLQRLRDSKDQLAQHSKALKELAEELEERCQRPALGLLEGVQGALSRGREAGPFHGAPQPPADSRPAQRAGRGAVEGRAPQPRAIRHLALHPGLAELLIRETLLGGGGGSVGRVGPGHLPGLGAEEGGSHAIPGERRLGPVAAARLRVHGAGLPVRAPAAARAAAPHRGLPGLRGGRGVLLQRHGRVLYLQLQPGVIGCPPALLLRLRRGAADLATDGRSRGRELGIRGPP
ncbi:E3 ubiquitin-protein ligase TRIM58-like isoform X5 [Marmota flaviventris]|uniref:E3 ubiquitin-protein ligase TRIM58-like isoform X5 n=1 Tax=Marmota flaviventris TaxID=93162 RepID=UPI003A8905B2